MRRLRNDDGAYAILYAVLVVVLLGMGALVVDIAMMRTDKRDARSASDFASLAGANDVGTGPYTPQKACQSAWAYALQTLGVNAPSSPCSSWPASVNACPSAPSYSPAVASSTSSGITIRVWWPVPSTDSALTNPDGLADGSSRTYDADFDGSTAGCDRLAVQVDKVRSLALANAIGFSSGVSGSRSVARFTEKPGDAEYPYPLVLLDQHSCTTLAVNGGTQVLVRNNGDTPGRIGVDSDGTTNCSGGQNSANGVILDAGGTGSVLQAFDGADGSKSSIEVFGPTGLPANTAISTKVHDCTSGTPCIWPAPILRLTRITRAPFDFVFDCDGSAKCPTGSPIQAYVTRFVNAAAAVTSTTAGWTVINSTSTPACGATSPVLPASTQYFIDCGTGGGFGNWSLNGHWVFPAGATVIVNSTLTIPNDGCFAMNADPVVLPDPCAAPYAPPEPSSLSANAMLSVRGDINAGGSSSLANGPELVLPRTFVSQPLNASRLKGAGFRVFSWTAPYGDKDALAADCGTSTVVADFPPASCFRNLAYWSEAPAPDNDPEVINGGGALHLEGTFFMGNAKLKLAGGSSIDVASSQFVAKRLEAFGGSILTFIPNPDRTTGVPVYGVTLIR